MNSGNRMLAKVHIHKYLVPVRKEWVIGKDSFKDPVCI